MKNVKTITLAIVLTAICSFALVPAFASDAAGDDAELKLESVTAHAGDKNVEVKLDLVYNPGIWGISAEVNYDEKLTLVSVAHGELVDITDGPLDFNPYTVYGEGKSTTADVTATGTVITLRFDVAEDASGVLPLTFGLVELYNVNGTEVDYLAEDGFITIAAPEVHVTGVSLNKTSLELETGEQETLTAAIEPGNATNKEVAWKTSNGKVATVGSDGVVKAVSAGTAVITVTTVDGGKAAVCEVTVKAKVIPVTGVTLDKSSLDLSVGSTYTLKATVSPSDATNKGVTWSTSNASVATVANGIVKGVSAGTATITVTTEDGNKTAACEVTVKEISVTGVLLDKNSLSLTVGSEAELKATVLPSNAGNKNVSWSTSNASVATVDNGKVKAVSPGTATITVTTEDGNKTATCNVTVTEAAPVAVTGVTLDRNTLGLVTGSEAELKATVMPSDAANKNVSWTTSSASVATVDNGKVKAVSPGTAVITVITEDGNKTATCTVTVTSAPVAVTGVTLDKIALALKDGAQGQLTAIVTPSDATNKDVTWSSSNASVATVDNGKVTAVSPGTAIITVTTVDGNKTANCAVTVSAVEVTGVVLDKTSVSLETGDTVALKATVSPSDATDKRVKWATSDGKVATVSNDGVVKAVSAGTAVISVITEDGNKTATCSVTVTESSSSGSDNTWIYIGIAAGVIIVLLALIFIMRARNKTS